MRIGLVIYGSLDTISGGYLYDRMLVDYLQRQGEHVEVITLPWRSYPLHLADNLSPALSRRLSQLEVDVLLQDELNHPSLFWINQRMRSRKSPHRQQTGLPPIISIVHHLRSSELYPAWQMPLYRWVERRYLQSVDGFIYNSQTTRKSVEAVIGTSAPNIVALPPSGQFLPEIQPEEIVRRANQSGPLRLIFVGNLIPRKGLHTLLAAIQPTPEGSLTLTVVGGALAEAGYARQIQKQMNNHSLQNRVRLHGLLNQAELATQLKHHHLLVVPSSYEGFGIAYLEGMGFGLPAIGTTSGGASEVISHGTDGFLVAPNDPVSLRRHLLELNADRSRLAEMGLAARNRFLSHPAWETTARSIHSFLENNATLNVRSERL